MDYHWDPFEEPKDEPDTVLEAYECDEMVPCSVLVVRVGGAWYQVHSGIYNAILQPLQ